MWPNTLFGNYRGDAVFAPGGLMGQQFGPLPPIFSGTSLPTPSPPDKRDMGSTVTNPNTPSNPNITGSPGPLTPQQGPTFQQTPSGNTGNDISSATAIGSNPTAPGMPAPTPVQSGPSLPSLPSLPGIPNMLYGGLGRAGDLATGSSLPNPNAAQGSGLYGGIRGGAPNYAGMWNYLQGFR